MTRQLLNCAKGFLDAEEVIPVDGLTHVAYVEVPATITNVRDMDEFAKRIGLAYGYGPSKHEIYWAETDLGQTSPPLNLVHILKAQKEIKREDAQKA